MYSEIIMKIRKRILVFFFLFFGTLPEIKILKVVNTYIKPTERSNISTPEPDFQLIPIKDMLVKSEDELFKPEKKIIKKEIPKS